MSTAQAPSELDRGTLLLSVTKESPVGCPHRGLGTRSRAHVSAGPCCLLRGEAHAKT